jgi:hypothetical protein
LAAIETQADRSRNRRQVIEDTPDFGTAQSTCGQMLRAGQDRFVLEIS